MDTYYTNQRPVATAIKGTDNYYVFFNRENLYELPYSVEEIYEIRTSGKYHSLQKIYKQKPGYTYAHSSKKQISNILLTEDSEAENAFYCQASHFEKPEKQEH